MDISDQANISGWFYHIGIFSRGPGLIQKDGPDSWITAPD